MTRTRYYKSKKQINVTTSCEVDVDVDIDLDDFIGEIEDIDILAECVKRGLIRDKNTYELSKTSICDHFGISYFTPTDKIIELVKELL